jgi:hypothetical protein
VCFFFFFFFFLIFRGGREARIGERNILVRKPQGKRTFVNIDADIKMGLNEKYDVVGSFEHHDKLSGSIKIGGISWTSKRLVLLRKDCVPWCHFFGYFGKEMYGQAHSWASCGVAAE